ncbi:MAG: helix-turn-helix transcriptional regulator [Chitinophagales bacterium]
MKAIPVRRIASQQALRASAEKFSIRALKQLLNGKDLVHGHHKHDFYFVLALLKGKGRHEIDFTKYPVSSHSIFILRPGQVHKLELGAESEGFIIEFDLSFYQPRNTITEHRWKKATGKNFCEVEAARFDKIYNYLSAVFSEYTLKQEGYVSAIKANLDLFFIEYIRQSRAPQSIAKSESAYVQDRFDELLLLIEKHICTKKNVSQYSKMLNLSPYQLNAVTKNSVGKTVSELINEQLVIEAKRHLLATPEQIKDIASNLGYEDVSYFIRFFKKHTGQSPESFRRHFK